MVKEQFWAIIAQQCTLAPLTQKTNIDLRRNTRGSLYYKVYREIAKSKSEMNGELGQTWSGRWGSGLSQTEWQQTGD